MTWHRDDGAHVVPLPLTSRLRAVRGAAAVSGSLLLTAPGAFALILIVGIVDEETLGLGIPLEAVRALVLITALLTLAGLVAEPIRVAVERARLLEAAGAVDSRQPCPPPAGERRSLWLGPHPVLRRTGCWAAMLAAGLGMFGVLFASFDEGTPLARVLAVLVPAAVTAAGAVLALRNGPRGASRKRWERHESRYAARWQVSVTPVERAPRARRSVARGVLVAVLALGTVCFVVGMWLRQPGRSAEPRRLEPVGEAAIDVLVTLGASVLLLTLVAAAALGVVWLATRSRRDATAIRAIEGGEAPDSASVDAIVLDPAPLERAASVVGAVGWLLAIVGLVPVGVGLLLSWVEAATFGPLSLVLLPAVACLAAAFALGTRGARRAHARRTAVLAVVQRDPVQWVRPFSSWERPEDHWQLAPGFSGHWGI